MAVVFDTVQASNFRMTITIRCYGKEVGRGLQGVACLPGLSAVLQLQSLSVESCSVVLLRSDPESFDARSLVIDKVDFSFFESREFFVATDAMCSQQLQDVPVRKVPREAFAKQALLEQRSLVKQLNEGLRAVKMQDGTQLAKMRKPAKNVERETILAPVVELHLFPTVPDDATAPWKALVVQRSREVCGRTLYLCEAQELDAKFST